MCVITILYRTYISDWLLLVLVLSVVLLLVLVLSVVLLLTVPSVCLPYTTTVNNIATIPEQHQWQQ